MAEDRDVITIRNLGIQFVRNRRRRLRAKDIVLGKMPPSETFWALRHVNLSVRHGESLGVVGANGSGKSTLLKVIAAVLIPDEGTVKVTKEVAPLLELTSGFSPNLSARDNVILSGVIHGMTRDEIETRLDDIIDFAEVRDFIDTPVRHFSSGMKARLGFAIVTQLEHPILLIDEALAVGDRSFRRRCLQTIREIEKTRTVILVSHNDKHVSQLCERSIYLANGEVSADGDTEDILKMYRTETGA